LELCPLGAELGCESVDLCLAGAKLLLARGERGGRALELCALIGGELALHGREQVPLRPVQPQSPTEPALPLAELALLALELALALLDRAGALAQPALQRLELLLRPHAALSLHLLRHRAGNLHALCGFRTAE
jgi:hypothetical protein